ncbi:MAG: hypothetical protein HWN65_18675 [Candidatus Helarchaeota archaeon]|nr:hypothetical protein [Candidatus Helarchaeota archaeon]
MDEFSKTLKDRKQKKEEKKVDPAKKAKIMGMHAEGDEINYIRCEECGARFPAQELQELDGLYYCSNCIKQIKLEE